MHRYVNRIILVLAIVGRRRQNMQYGFAVGGPRTTIEYDAVLEVPQPKVQLGPIPVLIAVGVFGVRTVHRSVARADPSPGRLGLRHLQTVGRLRRCSVRPVREAVPPPKRSTGSLIAATTIIIIKPSIVCSS